MKKENMLKMLEIIYDEANNYITTSRQTTIGAQSMK